MNQFNIKDIENLSGIKAHTWRIWEQRYGLALPQRKDSNHRFYDNENLKQILRISFLYHKGFKISKIAALTTEEIKNQSITTLTKSTGTEFFLNKLLEAAIDLDEEKFEISFDAAIQKVGIEETFFNVLVNFQKKIGVLWLTDHLIPAQEHFTSNIIRQKLAVAIDALPPVKHSLKRTVAIFTPEKEHHEIPIQFLHYLLKRNQNKVIYFGSNVSLESVEIGLQKIRVTQIFFHLVTNLTNKNADEYLQTVVDKFADKQIIMSGVEVEKITKIPENVRLLKSITEIFDYVNE